MSHRSSKVARSTGTNDVTSRFRLSLLLVGLLIAIQSGCSTLGALGLPFGSSQNTMLDSTRAISEQPGQAIQTPKELLKQPLADYVCEVSDTIFIEAVNFDATIRLPGDQVIKPDGTVSIGEFGSYEAANKTIAQIQTEVQSVIDRQLRQDMEIQFAKEESERRLRQATEANFSDGLLADRMDLDGDSDELDFEDDEVSADSATDQAKQEQVRATERRRQLDKRIDERLRQNQVSARLVNWDSKRIYVLGEVNSPGYYPYTGNQTTLDALVEAGGLTTKANGHQIIVSRPTPCGSCRIVMKFCYDQVVQLGDTSTNYQLLPGDRVFVPSLTFCDDLKQSFTSGDIKCPRCEDCQTGCNLPTGCATGSCEYGVVVE